VDAQIGNPVDRLGFIDLVATGQLIRNGKGPATWYTLSGDG